MWPSSILVRTHSSLFAVCGNVLCQAYQPEKLDQIGKPGAIILSGGPSSTSDPDAPDIDFELLKHYGTPFSVFVMGCNCLYQVWWFGKI